MQTYILFYFIFEKMQTFIYRAKLAQDIQSQGRFNNL